MISVSFQLTPAQTKMLLLVAFEHYEGDLCLPAFHNGRNDFVTVVQGLIRRGLVDHDSNRCPAYVATDTGRALAKVIVDGCKQAVNLEAGIEDRRKVWKKLADATNRLKERRMKAGGKP